MSIYYNNHLLQFYIYSNSMVIITKEFHEMKNLYYQLWLIHLSFICYANLLFIYYIYLPFMCFTYLLLIYYTYLLIIYYTYLLFISYSLFSFIY